MDRRHIRAGSAAAEDYRGGRFITDDWQFGWSFDYRPASAIELTYGRTEETIALAIDPSKSTPKGELRYNETTMLSDNPVAVWLFGTVLNYAIGIPDSMVRNLEPGDRVTLNTDTGASLHFVVAETGRGANYEAGRLLSQNRLGLTLFALPAAAEDDVSFAVANYDVASEEEQAQTVYETGERAPLGGAELQVLATQFSHTEDGSIRIVVDGVIAGLAAEQAVMLSLASAKEQTTAVPLTPDESGAWRTLFILPGRVAGSPLFAEFRALPGGALSIVQLGEAPRLTDQLEVEIAGTWWDADREEAVVEISLHNPGVGAVYLDAEFIRFPTEGGDADEITGQITPRLPTLIPPGETRGITVSFLPQALSVQLQINVGLWEVSGFPTE